jgi:hypothetical protein
MAVPNPIVSTHSRQSAAWWAAPNGREPWVLALSVNRTMISGW